MNYDSKSQLTEIIENCNYLLNNDFSEKIDKFSPAKFDLEQSLIWLRNCQEKFWITYNNTK